LSDDEPYPLTPHRKTPTFDVRPVKEKVFTLGVPDEPPSLGGIEREHLPLGSDRGLESPDRRGSRGFPRRMNPHLDLDQLAENGRGLILLRPMKHRRMEEHLPSTWLDRLAEAEEPTR